MEGQPLERAGELFDGAKLVNGGPNLK